MPRTLIDEFKAKIDSWKTKCPDDDFIFNKDLGEINWNNIKYIIVGDNPGEMEKEVEEYLVSKDNAHTSSGYIAKKIFDYFEIEKNQDYVVLNKCPIFTKETASLKGKRLLKETQEYMANLTFNLHNMLGNDCKAYIFGLGGCYDLEKGWLSRTDNGKGNYYANQIMPFYFEKLKELYSASNLQESLFIMKHFSYWNIFSDLQYIEDTVKGPKVVNGKRVSLSLLKEKKIPKKELIEALEKLGYKEALFGSNNNV